MDINEVEIIKRMKEESLKPIIKDGFYYSYSGSDIGLNIKIDSVYRKEFNQIGQEIRYKGSISELKNSFNTALKLGYKPLMAGRPFYFEKTYNITIYFIKDEKFIRVKLESYSKKAFDEFIKSIQTKFNDLKAFEPVYIEKHLEEKGFKFDLSFETERIKFLTKEGILK